MTQELRERLGKQAGLKVCHMYTNILPKSLKCVFLLGKHVVPFHTIYYVIQRAFISRL